MTSPPPTQSDRITRRLVLLLILALAVLPAHFMHLRSLGVYEDDYWAIVPFLETGWRDIISHAGYHFNMWMTGRPLNYILPSVFASVGAKLGGLDGVYFLAAAALLLNCALIYRLLRHFLPAGTALFGAAFYGLFPADTTKPLLIHAAHVQFSATFSILALVLYLNRSNWRWLCYPVAALSLLSYESAYLPFVFCPLLVFAVSRAWLKQASWHVALCGITLAIIAMIRLGKGDARATSVAEGAGEAVLRSLQAVFIGPITSATQLVKGPWEVIPMMDATGFAVAAFAAFGLLLGWRLFHPGQGDGGHSEQSKIGSDRYWLLFPAGAVFWSVSYALAIVDPHFPPVSTIGRLTSVHVAAGIGASLVFGGLLEFFARLLPRRCLPLLACLATVYLGLLAGHAHRHQRGYAFAWKLQQDFWGQVLRLAPDLSAGTAVLVTGPQAPMSGSIASNSWADALVLQHFFRLPPGTEPPVLVMLNNCGDAIQIHQSDGAIRWRPWFWSGVETNLNPDNVIVLQSDSGKLQRIDKIYLPTLGGYLHSKPAGPPAEWSHSYFYGQMLARELPLP